MLAAREPPGKEDAVAGAWKGHLSQGGDVGSPHPEHHAIVASEVLEGRSQLRRRIAALERQVLDGDAGARQRGTELAGRSVPDLVVAQHLHHPARPALPGAAQMARQASGGPCSSHTCRSQNRSVLSWVSAAETM